MPPKISAINDNTKFSDSFQSYYQTINTTVDMNYGNTIETVGNTSILAVNPYEKETSYTVIYNEKCLADDPALNFTNVAKKRLALCVPAVQQQVLNACRLNDFDYARRTLLVNNLFSHNHWLKLVR